MAAQLSVLDESDASMRARLVESLSNSFPGSALSRALHAMDENQEKEQDPLSSSCYAEIRLDKVKVEPESDDDELTSLAWLQDGDLLKNLSSGDGNSLYSPIDLQKENSGLDMNLGQAHPPHVPYNPQKHVNSKPPYSFSCLIFMAVEDSPSKKLPVKDIYNWILTHFPYFQNAPTGWKNSVRHNLSLNKCFKKVEKEKGSSIGKGSLWCIDPDYRPNLLQALRKTPYHPYHQLQILNNITPFSNTAGYTVFSPRSRPLAPKLDLNSPSPQLFPFLSRRLAQSKFDADSDIDVANTLVSLKRAAESRRPLQCRNGGRSRSPSPPEFGSEREKQMLKRRMRASKPKAPVVVTSHPSDDHTYSVSEQQRTNAPHSPVSSIDEEYEFGGAGVSTSDVEEERFSHSEFEDDCSDEENMQTQNGLNLKLAKELASPFKKRLMTARDADEEMKIVEGADALLNLAGIRTVSMPKVRSLSPQHNNNNNNNNKKAGAEIDLNKIKKEPVEEAESCTNNSSREKKTEGNNQLGDAEIKMEVDDAAKSQSRESNDNKDIQEEEDMDTNEISQ